jgi:hypothetical protein
VVEQVRQSGAEVLSRALAAARPIAVDAERAVLKLGFPPSAAFNKRKAEAQDARDRFAEALGATVGARLRPVYVLLDGDAEEASGPLSDDELIARLKAEFDAEELGDEDDAGTAERTRPNAGSDADVGIAGEGGAA